MNKLTSGRETIIGFKRADGTYMTRVDADRMQRAKIERHQERIDVGRAIMWQYHRGGYEQEKNKPSILTIVVVILFLCFVPCIIGSIIY